MRDCARVCFASYTRLVPSRWSDPLAETSSMGKPGAFVHDLNLEATFLLPVNTLFDTYEDCMIRSNYVLSSGYVRILKLVFRIAVTVSPSNFDVPYKMHAAGPVLGL